MIKTYIKDGIYHIYNRGVEKRIIFENEQDYKIFMNYLGEYLTVPENTLKMLKTFSTRGNTFKGMPRQCKNYSDDIQLLAYCLMPNHFHLMLKLLNKNSLHLFMKSLLTRYSMYFNKKYDRVGALFQGTYKAALVLEDPYLLHLSRYIHLNPRGINKDIVSAHSSYAEYLKLRNTDWVKTDFVLSYFDNNTNLAFRKFNSYRKFVESNSQDIFETIGRLGIDN
ncbi:MAG: transposase [bacterium]|nr:transposase [bacterium]